MWYRNLAKVLVSKFADEKNEILGCAKLQVVRLRAPAARTPATSWPFTRPKPKGRAASTGASPPTIATRPATGGGLKEYHEALTGTPRA